MSTHDENADEIDNMATVETSAESVKDESSAEVEAAAGDGDDDGEASDSDADSDAAPQKKGVKRKVSDKVRKTLHLNEYREKTTIPKFMKFIMVLFVINFVFSIFFLALSSRDLYDYNVVNLLDFANIVLEMVFIWMVCRRFKVARLFIICVGLLNIAVGTINSITLSEFDIIGQLLSSWFDIVLVLYFATSRKAKACLNAEFTFEHDEVVEDTGHVARKGWPFIRNLIIYYCVFSLVGHWMEAGCCQLMRMGLLRGDYDPTNTLLWRDWFYPFPMEGLAVVLIALLLYPLWRWLLKKFKNPIPAFIISFIANMFVCVCIEFIMGLFVNADHQLWDYTYEPFNFMGQICAQNAIGFGIVASLIAWVVYPFCEKMLAKIPKNVMGVVFVLIVAAYAIPQSLYLIDPPQGIGEIASLEYIVKNEDGVYTEEQVAEAEQELAYLNQLQADHEAYQQRLAEIKEQQRAQQGSQ